MRRSSQLFLRIRERSLEDLKESDNQRGCVSLEDRQYESK
jgi:hypothetical protein